MADPELASTAGSEAAEEGADDRRSQESVPLQHSVIKRPTNPPPRGQYFEDGRRRIDFVLAYELGDADEVYVVDKKTREEVVFDKKGKHRRAFERRLRALGLELEQCAAERSKTGFVLVHAPFRVLVRQADLLKLKKAVYQNEIIDDSNVINVKLKALRKRPKAFDLDGAAKARMQTGSFFCAPFAADHIDSFMGSTEPDTFFTGPERAYMVFDLLQRAFYSRKDFGVERLLEEGTYSAAYSLHEELDEHVYDPATCSTRQLLVENWVKLKNVTKYQPLRWIKEYFGCKLGFYFAWLGFYTSALGYVAILGVFCALYGLTTVWTDQNTRIYCNDTRTLICPTCRGDECDFTPLHDNCMYARLTHIFDNNSTILFAVIMAIWSTLFLEGWKRRQAVLAYKWNALDLEQMDETLRPEFVAHARSVRVNPVSGKPEPHIHRRERWLRFSVSAVAVVFCLLLVLALLIGMEVYRMIAHTVFKGVEKFHLISTNAALLTQLTSSIINLVFIMVMSQVYRTIALKLTEIECPRTSSEFENSHVLKVFLFEFINYYSPCFYIAFLKGRLSGPPEGKVPWPGPRLFGERLEECPPNGCMVELVIQLFITMCGEQFIEAVGEIGQPIFCNAFRNWRWRFHVFWQTRVLKKSPASLANAEKADPTDTQALSQVEKDFLLEELSEHYLFEEYLEMVMQFGFCTLFACALPLTPLFALLNNMLEIRLDAFKFTQAQRRPVYEPAKDIGLWLDILSFLSNLGVLCNACVMAFTSDLVPRLLHFFQPEPTDFVDSTLSFYDARQLAPFKSNFTGTAMCRYPGYRLPPCSLAGRTPGWALVEGCDNDLAYSKKWWILLAFRLTFVLAFQLIVFSIKTFFDYMIPDMPTKVMVQQQRERYMARAAAIRAAAKMFNIEEEEVADDGEFTPAEDMEEEEEEERTQEGSTTSVRTANELEDDRTAKRQLEEDQVEEKVPLKMANALESEKPRKQEVPEALVQLYAKHHKPSEIAGNPSLPTETTSRPAGEPPRHLPKPNPTQEQSVTLADTDEVDEAE